MEWVMGAVHEDGQQRFLAWSKHANVESVDAKSLAVIGMPSVVATKRAIFTGDISAWVRTTGDEYLEAFGIALPAELTNRHAVFRTHLGDGTVVHVPALALARAFFRPHRLLMPRIFTPGNVDLLGFIDYSSNPPSAVVDAEFERSVDFRDGDYYFEPLRWLHSSRTARMCAQSVYFNAMAGLLDFQLPQGQFRLVLHGYKVVATLFVTKVNVVSVTVPADDCIAESEQSFIFHGMASAKRKVSSGPDFPAVPLRQNNQVVLTDDEWKAVAPLLVGQTRKSQRNCRRALLDAILLRLSNVQPWKSVMQTSGFDKNTLTSTFRRWQLDGRLARVLAALALVRGAEFAHRAELINGLTTTGSYETAHARPPK